MRSVFLAAAIVLLVVALASAQAGGPENLRAADVARDLLDRAAAAGSDAVVPKALLRSASVGEALAVHDARTLRVAYRVVPVQAGGRTVGIVAVDSASEGFLWCRFNIPDGRFPAVTAAEAGDAVGARRRALGLAAEAGGPILVQGCDKHLYWRFGSEGESWYADAVASGAAIVTSLDGSNRAVTAPEPAGRHIDETPDGAGRDLGQEPGDGAAFANPAAYVIPGIPYHFQIVDWYCGPAALQMVMDWLGEEIGQYDIGDVANEAPSYGCMDTDMRRAAQFSGMSAAVQNPALQGYTERKLGYACVDKKIFTNTIQRLKNTIVAGYPVYTLTWYDGGHYGGHFRVVKGYDDGLGVFVIHDPWYFGTLSGPDLLVDQAFFADDLWDYDAHWGMVVSPWILTPSFPESVAEGDTFEVNLRVLYPGPTYFAGSFPGSGGQATISLASGLALAGGSATLALPNLDSGDTASVSWSVVALGPAGDWGMAFQAQGTITGSSAAYASYTDSIGGHAYEEVAVGSGSVAGWEEEERLTSDVSSSETCLPGGRAMVVGQDGAAHLVWADMRDANGEIYYRRRAGDAWGAETRLTSNPGHSHSPCIAVDPAGGLHVAWVDDRDGNHEIYYKRWTSASGWSADERVTNYYEVDYHPSIAASSTKAYVAWESRVDGWDRAATVYMAVRSAGGWSAAAEVDPSVYRDRYRPSVAFGADGLVDIVYERQTSDTPDEQEEIVHRAWNGTVWSAATVLSSSASFSRNPVVAVGSGSTAHVVWQDGENVGGDIFYAYYDGLSWHPSEEIATGAAEAGTPSVAVDAGGAVWVAWADDRNGESEIYSVSKDSGGWGEPERLSQASGASMLPTTAAGAGGEACVVWTDLRNGNPDLYFRARSGLSGAGGGPFAATDGRLQVSRARPAPFTSETRLALRLQEATDARIEVFDVAGRLVRTLHQGALGAGVHDVIWDGRRYGGERASPGVYFVRCSTPLGREVRPVVLVR